MLGFIPVNRWVVVDMARATRARATLQAVAQGAVAAEPTQAALAGLAVAIGAASYVFPGVAGVLSAATAAATAAATSGGSFP